MKILVVFYSLTENTKFIAETIAKNFNADVLELRTKKELIKKDGFLKYFWGGHQVFMKEMPELVPFEKNPAEYDLIFIGTPVWAWNFVPPIRTFFSSVKLTGKNIALFCTHGGGPKNTLANMEKELPENRIVGKIDFREPLKSDKEGAEKRCIDWVRKIIADVT